MPKILIVAATKQEIEPFLNVFHFDVRGDIGFYTSPSHPGLAVLITGVGMVNTAHFMALFILSSFP